ARTRAGLGLHVQSAQPGTGAHRDRRLRARRLGRHGVLGAPGSRRRLGAPHGTRRDHRRRRRPARQRGGCRALRANETACYAGFRSVTAGARGCRRRCLTRSHSHSTERDP
ncbi:MAG: hypothetical protein ACTMIY_08365, partial [Microbacterium gubbeenense]